MRRTENEIMTFKYTLWAKKIVNRLILRQFMRLFSKFVH